MATDNLVYSPYPRVDVDVGIEGRLGRRWLESGAEGNLARLHFLHALQLPTTSNF